MPTSFSSLSLGNACIDLFVKIDGKNIDELSRISFAAGEKCHMSDALQACGGGACNTAVGLKRLGLNAAFGGILGSDDWGNHIIHTLQKEGVHIDSATILEGEMSSVSLIIRLESGERIIFSNTGTNGHLQDALLDSETLKAVDVIYLNRLSKESCMIEDDIVRVLAERRYSHLTWNPGGCQIDRGMDYPETRALLRHTSLLLLNKEESLTFTKTETVQDALHTLKKTGVNIVCITDGQNGAFALDDHELLFMPTDTKQTIVDTTGAGDAFGVGMTWALIQGKRLSEALLSGTLNALSVVSMIGAEAGLLTEQQMKSARENTTLSVQSL
jgi:ribokinase